MLQADSLALVSEGILVDRKHNYRSHCYPKPEAAEASPFPEHHKHALQQWLDNESI